MKKPIREAQHVPTQTASLNLALTAAAIVLSLSAVTAQAEITQDCILEGRVDTRKAEQLGQPTYVKFSDARNGPEASCNINRRSKSRRVQFVGSPDTSIAEGAAHGTRVSYRYIERENEPGSWELIKVGDK